MSKDRSRGPAKTTIFKIIFLMFLHHGMGLSKNEYEYFCVISLITLLYRGKTDKFGAFCEKLDFYRDFM